MKNPVQIKVPKNALIQSDEDIEILPPLERGHDLLFKVFCNGIPIAEALLERQHQPQSGFTSSMLLFAEHYLPTYKLSYIEVDEDHRNRGIGTVLLREVLHHCQSNRVKQLLAEVTGLDNPRLQHWYLNHGFDFAGRNLLELTFNVE